MSRGKYIVIEGVQGTGKTTQITKLSSMMASQGMLVKVLREPDSQSDLTARSIRHITQDPRYEMNTKTEVLLYNAARSQSLEVIRKSLDQGINCLVDRNYLTTLAIQYYARGDVENYEDIISIINFAVEDMEPDLTIVLDAPVSVLQERMRSRNAGERFDQLDAEFMEKMRAGYLWEAKNRNYPVVFVNKNVDQVFNEIWEHVYKALNTPELSRPTEIKQIISEKYGDIAPPITKTAKADASSNSQTISTNITEVEQTESYIASSEHGHEMTDAGKRELEKYITNVNDNVYAFNENLSPVTIAAAMARLSRRGDDMRVTLLDEFIGSIGKDEGLLKRVITAYGDDSVQQLVGQHVVVEGASNLLTKKLEWGRLASYLEQSTRYIYFDQTDQAGKYKYYTPEDFDRKTKQKYNQTLDQIFKLYSEMVRELTEYVRAKSSVPNKEQDLAWKGATRAQACDAIRPVLPVATKSTVGIFASGQALESLIMHLLADDLPEAKTTGQKLLEESRKVLSTFLERADKPDRGGAWQAYKAESYSSVAKLANEYLPNSYPSADELKSVDLVDVHPRNELDIVPYILYEHSSSSLESLKKEVTGWPYTKKQEVFESFVGKRLNRRQRPGRALENVHYSFDLLCDYGIFRDLQRHRMVDDLNWQFLSPRYGFEIPELVEKAGLTEKFEKCFDLSLELYSYLQSAGYELEAQYATLLGHKMRWKVTFNAREAFQMLELRTAPQGHPGYRKLAKEMHEKIAEVHPLIASSMIFINKDEDPELTRLSAERYTQYKLNQKGS